MDIAYLHVVINHLPIMGVPVVLGVLLLGLWTRDHQIRRAALLGFVVLGVLTVPVFLTGLGGEDFIEDLPGMSEDAIDAHEAVATWAFVAVEALAVLSLAVFLRHGGMAMLGRVPTAGRGVPTAACMLVALVAVVASGVLGLAGRLGGKISHTEFADGVVAVAAQGDALEDAADAAEDAAEDRADAAEDAADDAADRAEDGAEAEAERLEDAAEREERQRRRQRGRG
jgi:hypothetical protein